MRVFWLGAVLLVAFMQPAKSNVPASLDGEWHQTDLRSIEVMPGGTCLRVWLEERTYAIQSSGKDRYTGAYSNMIRSVPVSPTSFAPTCQFPPPATNPLASQTRMWTVVLTAQGVNTWRVRAQPMPGLGDLTVFKTDEFETTLTWSQGTLEDGVGQAPAATAVVFHPTESSSVAARRLIEDTVEQLDSGGCLRVMAAITGEPGRVAEICNLRRQMTALLGTFVSLNIESEDPFDRLPGGFLLPSRASAALQTQHGILFSFTARYEKAKVPGNALLLEDAGKWRVAVLWF